MASRKKIQKPSNVTTGIATITPDTTEEYKNVVEREYKPKPVLKAIDPVQFLGCGMLLPEIDGKTVRIKFEKNMYIAKDEKVIKYLRNAGYQEAV